MVNKARKTDVIKYRHDLHKIPETGFDLIKTKHYVKTTLETLGYTVKECGKCGLVTEIGEGTKTFLLRADMDALPFEDGNKHACGHDMHTAMLLGAAKLLMDNRDKLQGRVRLMFQSAEEIFEGSKDMILNGVLKNADAGLMIHVTTGVSLPTGTVIVSSPGIGAPSADIFSITVKGKGCHGSAPWNGTDPITAGANIVMSLQNLISRELPPSAVLTVGCFNAGTAPNAIPDTAFLRGSIRAYDENTRQTIKSRLEEISHSVGLAYKTKTDVTFDSGCPTLLNDKTLYKQIKKYVTDLVGKQLTLDSKDFPRGGGSEDFAYVSHRIPTLMLALCAGNFDEGYTYPQHHPKVRFDDNALCYGAALYAHIAMSWTESTSVSGR